MCFDYMTLEGALEFNATLFYSVVIYLRSVAD